MDIAYFQEADRLNETAAGLLLDQIREKPDLLLCAATGNSPTGIYKKLVASLKRGTFNSPDSSGSSNWMNGQGLNAEGREAVNVISGNTC